MNIPERTDSLKKGLLRMIAYIKQFHDTKKMEIVEIGSWTGVSAEIFCHHFKHVYCIDAWKKIPGTKTEKYDMHEVEKIFDDRMQIYNNFTKIKMLFHEASRFHFEDKLVDIVYIDGNHSYKAVKQDIIDWLHIARLYISGHDFWASKYPGVIKAVKEELGKLDKTFSDTSWIKKI